jgi:hypothetical protein
MFAWEMLPLLLTEMTGAGRLTLDAEKEDAL